jgi:hypothetical protein
MDWQNAEAMTDWLEIPAAGSTFLEGSQYPTITAAVLSFRGLIYRTAIFICSDLIAKA